jgi:hypothetical protein
MPVGARSDRKGRIFTAFYQYPGLSFGEVNSSRGFSQEKFQSPIAIPTAIGIGVLNAETLPG